MFLTDIAILLVCGACAGFLAGLLGVGGGGMILVPLIIIVFNHQGFSQDIIVHMAIATGMTTILFISLSAIRAHHRHGSIDWKLVAGFTLGIIVGSF